MNTNEFRCAVATLRGLEPADLVRAEIIDADNEKQCDRFAKDSVAAFLRSDDCQMAAIWKLVQDRVQQQMARNGHERAPAPAARNECLPDLLRAVAAGGAARDSRQDVIFRAAADEIERLRDQVARQPRELVG